MGHIKNDSGLKVVLCLLGNLHSFLYLNFPLSALISVKYCWWMFIQAKELLVGNYRNMDFHSFTLIKGQLVEEKGKSRKLFKKKHSLAIFASKNSKIPKGLPSFWEIWWPCIDLITRRLRFKHNSSLSVSFSLALYFGEISPWLSAALNGAGT